MNVLLALLVAHLVADFPLQGDAVAVHKGRHVHDALSRAVPWWYWMTAHAAAHALAVFLVTQSLGCALAEFVCHWLIDTAKCEGCFSIHVDQALHVACKLAYVAVLLW